MESESINAIWDDFDRGMSRMVHFRIAIRLVVIKFHIPGTYLHILEPFVELFFLDVLSSFSVQAL